MDRIRIVGGQALHGTIQVSGAKNAALPLMIASLLTPEPVIAATTCPGSPTSTCWSASWATMASTTRSTASGPGQTPRALGRPCKLCAEHIVDTTAPYELVSKMRASFWVDRAAARPHGGGAGIAAGRLRDRYPPGRPAA